MKIMRILGKRAKKNFKKDDLIKSMIKKICVVTGSRADYDHLYWLNKLKKK